MTLVGKIHGAYVHTRRVRVLADYLARRLPNQGQVLDIGCGDGLLAASILNVRGGLSITGIDVLVREDAKIPVTAYDGSVIPFADKTFDAALLVDVLHHTDDPSVLLAESIRVAKTVILKDHLADGFMAISTLRFMDRVGNARFGVALPYNYWRSRQWTEAFERLGVSVEEWDNKVPLYQAPASLIFGRGLHFVTRLVPTS